MANYKIVDADRLDADMTGLADVIRQRAGTAGKLEFPEEMKEAVRNIQGGVELPALDNPGTAGDVALGKQFIDGNGSVIEGTLEEKYVLQISDQVSVETDDGTIELVAPVQTDCIIRKGKYSRLIARASAFGDALPEQVTKGTTFTSAYGVNIEGTMEPGSGGVNTSDATATAEDIAIGKTAYVNGEMVTGTIEDGDTWHYYYDGGVSAYEEDGAICFDHAFDKDVLYRKGERIILAHSDLGDALPQEVVKGRTFTTSKGVKIEGTMEPGSGGGEISDIEKQWLAMIERDGAQVTMLPNGVTTIGERAFQDCTNLVLTSLPEGITSIQMCGFQGCTNLALTSLPESLKYIGNQAFYSCINLAITSLPSQIGYVNFNAFYNCQKLTEITFKNKPINIGSAFGNCPNLKTINVPWAEGEVSGAPWGATSATINYNYTGG